MNLDEVGERLEQIENDFVKVWNNKEVPDWMVRDANIKRNKEVGELLKNLKLNLMGLKDAEKEVSKLRNENFWLRNKLKLIRNVLDRK